ncbi:phage tail spike protein [Mesobacillus zeae]|uniref:Tail spike domain-containing protein n=1 Tax=Mesobacillus zeae TaxID=1917180 RepID=A0A398B854_9BACI|nr:phage tail spike protein [Mesobacillus zeae]RID85681.1 hypothetical protein D1970_08995 [Mesobacillus zeae]
MIKILNQQRQLVAILENAFKIGYEKGFNDIWTCKFSLPLNDPKNAECKPLYYVELWDHDEYIGLFRISPANTIKSESTNEITYECEHVLASLLDDVLFLYHQKDNWTTTQNLNYILSSQTEQRWKLGTVEITRYFSYKWENENLLSALFSVPKPFDQQYQWTWDTQSYPWTLNLVKPETKVTCEARYGKNQRGIEKDEDPTVVFNRIYALGYGEGINQLNIKKVNGGIPYVQDTDSIAKYGVRAYIFVDRRFENADTLKANVEGLLAKWKTPKVTYKGSAADIALITGEDSDKLKMGRIIRWVDDEIGTFEARIVKESKGDIKGNPGDVQLEIANKTEDLGTTTADLERRQQINELYAQGATNIDSYTFNDNVDSSYPAIIEFPFPDDMLNVNESILRIKTSKFRSYSRAVKAGGKAISQSTTSAGGGVVKSSTTAAGGETTFTSGFANPGFFLYTSIHLPNQTYDPHIHAVEVTDQLNHAHPVTTKAHSHPFQIQLDEHTHGMEISIPDHVHPIDYGIWEYDQLPSKLAVKVDGNLVSFDSLEGEINIIPFLRKDSEGRVTRDYHTIEVKPDDLARVSLIVRNRFFIQSRSGGNF